MDCSPHGCSSSFFGVQERGGIPTKEREAGLLHWSFKMSWFSRSCALLYKAVNNEEAIMHNQ